MRTMGLIIHIYPLPGTRIGDAALPVLPITCFSSTFFLDLAGPGEDRQHMKSSLQLGLLLSLLRQERQAAFNWGHFLLLGLNWGEKKVGTAQVRFLVLAPCGDKT